MSRKITILFVLALFVLALTSVAAFAAKAKTASNASGANQRGWVGSENIPATPIAGAESVGYDPSIGKPSIPASHQSLGFSPNAVKTVGSTYQDYQSNGSMGRRIVVGGGWVHNIIMVLPGPSTANRICEYDAYQISGAGTAETPDVDGTVGAGYPVIAFTSSGVAVITYHRVSAGGTRSGKDFALGAGSFTLFDFPVANCQGVIGGSDPTEGPYIWPYSAADVDAGQPILHVVAHESPPVSTTDMQSLVYYRSNAGLTGTGPTCGFWIDSVENIMAVVAADPGSDEVAIVYFQPADYAFTAGTQQRNNDVVYRKSSDLGQNWGPAISITNYDGADKERAYTDVDALYTDDGCLHVAWTAPGFDSGVSISTQAAKLRHWDDCQSCISLALDATNFDANGERGAWNMNVSKPNLSECTVGPNKLLYLTYTRFLSDDADATPDHSLAGFANGEIFAQVSSTTGETWGPPVNLTNTSSPNCAAGACFSEHWSSSAMYVSDSLRIFYVEDKDAGGIVQTEGAWTNSPVKNMSVACFSMATFVDLSATPAEFSYPYHTAPAEVKNEVITLTNSGNSTAAWSVADNPNVAWLTFSGLTSGNCPAGCINTNTFTAVITGPGAEGYYTTNIDVTFSSPDKGAQAVTTIPVELYNFINFYLPQNAALRTNINRLNVNQASQISANEAGRMFSYFADTTDYLYEGHLILGNSALNLTYSVFDQTGFPSASNPYGYLYAAVANTSQDSTGSPEYRTASGRGVNRDTTIGFSVNWFASKNPGLGNFYVGAFKVYKGTKNPSGSISGLNVAYYTDWDIPSDSVSDNTSGSDAGRNMVWQRGAYSAPNDLRYGATAAYRHSGAVVGGWVLDNPTYIYPEVGYENDTIWNLMQNLGVSTPQYRLFTGTDDQSGGVLIYRNQTLNGATNDTLKFIVVIAGTRNGGLAATTAAVDSAKAWACRNAVAFGMAGAAFCSVACTCGDANGDGTINISDAVYLIAYIFAGGPAPNPICRGDANGDNTVNISDAVYLIAYIFAGGPAPHCPL